MRHKGHGRPVSLFGEFGGGNLGNEASLDSAIAWARSLPVDVRAIGRAPDQLTAQHGIRALPMRGPRVTWPRVFRTLRRAVNLVFKVCDPLALGYHVATSRAVIVPGTGILESELGAPFRDMPLTLLLVALAARLTHRPFALVGVGASPSPERATSKAQHLTVRASSFTTCRDGYSQGVLRAFARGPVGLTPDVAFSLSTPPAQPRRTPPWRVGLGVLSYHDRAAADGGAARRDRYEQTVAETARRLLNEGHTVRVLTGDALDDPVAQRLVAALERDVPGCTQDGRVRYDRPDGWRTLAAQIAELDVVVASRYHNLVFAIMAGLPVVAAGYGSKFSALVSDSGAGVVAGRVEELTPQRLLEAFETVVTASEEYALAARNYTVGARANSARTWRRLSESLGLTPGAMAQPAPRRSHPGSPDGLGDPDGPEPR